MKPLRIIMFFVLMSLLPRCGQSSAERLDSGNLDSTGLDGADLALLDSVALDSVGLDLFPVDTADVALVEDVGDARVGDMGDDGPPLVISTTPADGAVEVALNAPITASFNEAMAPDSISNATFTLMQGATVVLGTVACFGETAIFTPDSQLDPTVIYTASITTGARDLAGNELVDGHSWSFTTWTQEAQVLPQEVVPLASSSTFAILASAAITNIPTSVITGDIGLIPDTGANISGFSDPGSCPEVTGNMYAVDATGPACALIDPVLLGNAKVDAGLAFANARAAVRGTPQAVSGNLNGLTLYPGLYESGSSLEISPAGFLYLDAQGDGDAVFIIRSATSITTEATSQVVLTNGAKASNVYWTAGSAVTLGVHSIMKGTLLAGTAISLQTGADLEGRALNHGPAAEAITLDSCIITVPVL